MARRKLIWARMAPAITVLGNIGAGSTFTESQDLLQTFRTQAGITAGPVGLTVMRMRFTISTQNWATALFAQAVFGVRVMDSNEAILAEADATNFGPVADPHADWMCYETIAPRGTSTATATPPLAIVHQVIDVRSMRKLDELGQTLVCVAQSVPPNAGVGGLTQPFSVVSSVLLALP